MAQQVINPAGIHGDAGLIPGSLNGLRIQRCPEQWCGSQTWLGSHVAVAVAVAYAHNSSLDWTPSWGTGIAQKKKKKKKKNLRIV